MAHPADDAADERFALEGFERLIAAQASAHATGEDDGGNVGRAVRVFAHRFSYQKSAGWLLRTAWEIRNSVTGRVNHPHPNLPPSRGKGLFRPL